MAGTNFSLEGEQAGRQCDITYNCRMLLTRSVYLLSSLWLPNLNRRMLLTIVHLLNLLGLSILNCRILQTQIVFPLNSLQVFN